MSLGHDGEVCWWGALTIHDAASEVPYVIAIADSWPPTPAGADYLGDAIPEPVQAGTCTCATLPDADRCCEGASAPPKFWRYPFERSTVSPGESAPLTIPNGAGIDHEFKVFQAESIPTCDAELRQVLSWAVLVAS
jgi:hypothetical protein